MHGASRAYANQDVGSETLEQGREPIPLERISTDGFL